MPIEPIAEDAPLLLPEGTRLVHIGPHKTGTSSVQAAFHEARAATDARGVHYAGRRRHSAVAVQAVAGRPGFFTDGEPASMSQWRGLVSDVRRAKRKRVVISSEFFADAPPDTVARIVNDLGGERVHIVVTLRPLARIVPSQWQQYVQSGMRTSYEQWLDAMFNKPPGSLTPSFWRRHRHDELIARWADVVGPDRVTVIIVDDRDHAMVLRVFERLTGLPEGILVAPDDRTNRSLTLPEIEAVRAFNVQFKAEGFSKPLMSKVMTFGAANYLKSREPAPGEARVETPQWAFDRIGEIAREMVESISALNVRVVGDLGSLAAVPASGIDGDQPASGIPPDVAASMAMGVLLSSGLARSDRRSPTRAGKRASPGLPLFAEPLETTRIPSDQLIGIVLGRFRTAIARRWQRLIHRNERGAPV